MADIVCSHLTCEVKSVDISILQIILGVVVDERNLYSLRSGWHVEGACELGTVNYS